MSGGPKPGWSEAVADRLLGIWDAVRAERGHMFGHPALYAEEEAGGVCLRGRIRAEAAERAVTELLESGRGTPFQPYGKSMALAVEAAELTEPLQWLTPDEADALGSDPW